MDTALSIKFGTDTGEVEEDVGSVRECPGGRPSTEESELLSGGLRTMESMTAPYTTRSSVFFPNRL